MLLVSVANPTSAFHLYSTDGTAHGGYGQPRAGSLLTCSDGAARGHAEVAKEPPVRSVARGTPAHALAGPERLAPSAAKTYVHLKVIRGQSTEPESTG